MVAKNKGFYRLPIAGTIYCIISRNLHAGGIDAA